MSTIAGMSPMASQMVTFWSNVNSYSALVTFSTFMVMQHNGHASISYRNPNHMVRAMVWCDTIAFTLSYISNTFLLPTQPCQRQIFSIVSNIFWSAKDGFKYAYLTYRCWVICNFQDRIIGPVFFGGTATLLSWVFFATRYSFTTENCTAFFPSSIYNGINLALYFHFALADIIPSALLIRKLHFASKQSEGLTAAGGVNKVDEVLKRESHRLLLTAVLMGLNTVLSAGKLITGASYWVPMNALIFTFCQLLLYLSSYEPKGVAGNTSGGGHIVSVGHQKKGTDIKKESLHTNSTQETSSKVAKTSSIV